jgi:hypothetical protein
MLVTMGALLNWRNIAITLIDRFFPIQFGTVNVIA